MAQDKEKLIRKNVLERHTFDDEYGKKVSNDFLQLSQIAQELK